MILRLGLRCFATVLLRFCLCFRRFSPGKLVFLADLVFFGGVFGTELWRTLDRKSGGLVGNFWCKILLVFA